MIRPIRQSVCSISAPFSEAAKAMVGNINGIEQKTKRKSVLKSPLRYPGGKTRGTKEIIKFFPPDFKLPDHRQRRFSRS